MRIGTLFSGIGAPEQALRRMGAKHSVAFACEFDKYARQSYKANYDIDDDHFHNDINDMDGKQYHGEIDIIVGGSPCQDFSIAGLRAGLDGHRGQLIWQYYRIIKEVMPPVFIYENVKGMLSDKKTNKKDKYGKTFADFLEVFEELGYKTKWQVLNTKDYGVPQNRERIYVVGFLGEERFNGFEFAPKIPLTKRLRDVLEEEVDEKYYINKPFELYNKDSQGNKLIDINKECNTLMAGTHGYCQGYIQELRMKQVGTIDIKGNDQIKRVYDSGGVCPALTTMQGGHREPKILDFTNSFNEQKTREYSEYSPTLRGSRFGLAVAEPKIIQLNNPKFSQQRVYSIDGIAPTTSAGNLGGGKEPCKHLTDDYRIRKLTPRECLRLQDFPDDFKIVVSNSQAYKQTGNSMSVNVLEMIFRQLGVESGDN